MLSFEERSRQYREYVQDYLKNWYQRFHKEPQSKLFEAMEYSLLAGGKRLRPVFAFEFCRLCGAHWQKATPCLFVTGCYFYLKLIFQFLFFRPCMELTHLEL